MTASPPDLRARLRTELTRALKHHDRIAAQVLRSAIGAIDNAEAVPTGQAPSADAGPLAGAAVGLGAAEAPRRELTAQDVIEIVEAEVVERRQAADEIGTAGRPNRAADLRREADLLESVLRAS